MKYLLLIPAVLLTGCLTTPVKRNFPEVPQEIMQACPDLKTVEQTEKLSDKKVEIEYEKHEVPVFDRQFIFFSGVILLLLVPVFKTITHLPPFIGMLLALGVLWIITDLLHAKKEPFKYLPRSTIP